jgi:hypothetical protein
MDARIIRHNGALTLMINGELFPLTTYKPTELKSPELFAETVARSVKDMADRGVHVHFVPLFFGWDGPGSYDFSPTDLRINQVLDADPDAYIIIRVQAEAMAPEWWMEANPDGILQFGCGREPEMPKAPYQTGRCPSLASSFWQEAGIPALQAMAVHVRQQPYAERIAGYLPTAYNTNEWFFRSYNELQVNDLCPAMQEAFRRYYREQTGKDVDVSVPDRMARSLADHCIFFHPDNPVVAYYRFQNTLCAETIMGITKGLREAHAPDHIIIGTFYGYSIGLSNFYWLADSGHLNLARLLEEDGPDFTCSPLDYFSRNIHDQPGGGFIWAQSTAPDSGMLAGKAYFGEDDFSPPNKEDYWQSQSTDMRQDAEILKRNFTFTLCKGQFQWWYDLHGHWFEGQDRLDAVESCVRIARAAIEVDRSPVAEIAVVTDERASWYLALDRQLQRAVFYENIHHTFGSIGAPIDLLMVSDLPKADLGRYRAVFFPNTFALAEHERDLIASLKSDGRTLVFYQAPGLIKPGADPAFSVEYMRELTGMNICETGILFQMRVTTDTAHPILQGLEDTTFGLHMEKPLSFYIADSTAETLGYYSGHGPAALAIKRFGDWTSVYCGVPGMPYRLARNLAKDAGVHLYHETSDILYANKSYVGVFTLTGGPKRVALPTPGYVADAFVGTRLADEPSNVITWDAEQYRTYLFALTTAQRAQTAGVRMNDALPAHR